MLSRLLAPVFCAFCGLAPPWSHAGAAGEVQFITLDPGHFHAALVQKTMYEQASPTVHVYAPEGPDVEDHLRRIAAFNTRAASPTRWVAKIYTGRDFLERMLREKPGNVVVISGNNRKKADYIKACVAAGLNVLADKPMCIDAAGYRVLEEAFSIAKRKNVLIYDIMTERSDIATVLQKELANNPDVFGKFVKGSLAEPAVVKESVHHFFKQVAGKPIKRPGWYFDTAQQGEGIVDVTTHLVDLVMWGCFPQQPIDFDRDVRMLRARRRPTLITRGQYEQVTRLKQFPEFLSSALNPDGALPCHANGEMTFTLKGVHVRISVGWDFQAPAGGGDTHFSVMRGSRANLVIRQGKEQNYRPELYVEPASAERRSALATALKQAVVGLQNDYPGVDLAAHGTGWHVRIPERRRMGHEAHFRQVTERYLKYLADGKLPAWEAPNMLTKYRITTAALEMARR